MKNLIFILTLILTTFSLNAQTKLDYLVFDKINEYREENNLVKLKWCDKTYLASEHHTNYMVQIGDVLHKEENNTPKPSDRLLLYGANFTLVGENCTSIYLTNLSVEDMATQIVQNWKESPAHNTTMLDTDFNSGAVSCKEGKLKIYGSYPFILSTLNISN